jgi:C-terminal processing protease CtpA/Prc
MKKVLLLVIASIFVFSCTQTDKDEPVIEKPDREEFDSKEPEIPGEIDELRNLEVFCRVWGFVKYHHPAYSLGETCNADSDLIELIPKIREAGANTRNWLLLKWIKELGKYDTNKEQWDQYVQNWGSAVSAIPKITVDLSWMNDIEILGEDLSAELGKLRFSVRTRRTKYLETTQVNVAFHEDAYSQIREPSMEYRLLALFRYWNIIEYFFPAKYMTDNNWNDVLLTHIPKFLEAAGELEYRKAAARLISEINDTHAVSDFIPAFGNYLLNISLAFVEDKLVAISAYGGIKRGDEIITIDGKLPSEIKAKVFEYFSISNEGGLFRETASYARMTNNQSITITYNSDGVSKTETFQTIQYRSNPTLLRSASTLAFRLVEDGAIGYIDAGYFDVADASEMMSLFRDTKGIIIDMRKYPNYNIFLLAYGYFTNQIKDHVKFLQADAHTPGVLYSFHYANTTFGPNYMTYNGKVIMIVNENTQSMGEYVTMILQTIPGSMTIGSQTAGADGNVSYFYLPGNILTVISGLGVNYPDGTETQRVGIRIDQVVKPTIAGIKAGRDELYDKAVELIKQ